MPLPTMMCLAIGGGVIGTALVLVEVVQVEYRNPSAHLVLETANSGVALLAAYLVFGRSRRHWRRQDLLLSQGLILLAAASLITTWFLLTTAVSRTATLAVWLPLTTRLVGVSILAAGAISHPRRRVHLRWRRWSLLPPIAVLVVLTIGLNLMATVLPVAVNPELPPAGLDGPPSHPVLLAGQLFVAASFAIACLAFARQARRDQDDELLRGMAPACALAAFAYLNYVVYPSMFSEWVYAGDFFRMAFYFLLLLGAAREISHYWAAQVDLAVTEDRRRLARELHDGVAQELAYIRSEIRPLGRFDGTRCSRVLVACDRALDEARQAIEVMGSGASEPLGFTLHRAVRQVAERYGVAVEFDLDDTVAATQDQRHSLLRIAREATTNAARHGGGTRIRVQLDTNPQNRRRLIVVDNGAGFDVCQTGAAPTGYGLISMRERATNLPGQFHVQSRPARTMITVTW